MDLKQRKRRLSLELDAEKKEKEAEREDNMNDDAKESLTELELQERTKLKDRLKELME
jgi:hypothetical protein